MLMIFLVNFGGFFNFTILFVSLIFLCFDVQLIFVFRILPNLISSSMSIGSNPLFASSFMSIGSNLKLSSSFTSIGSNSIFLLL